MKHTYVRQEVVEYIKSITCDVCKKNFVYDHLGELEIQEFHCVDFVGGYDSIFGDGAEVKCDICQHCLKELIGDYIQPEIYDEDDD